MINKDVILKQGGIVVDFLSLSQEIIDVMGFIMFFGQIPGRTVHVFEIEYFAVYLSGNISIYGVLLLLRSIVNASHFS